MPIFKIRLTHKFFTKVKYSLFNNFFTYLLTKLTCRVLKTSSILLSLKLEESSHCSKRTTVIAHTQNELLFLLKIVRRPGQSLMLCCYTDAHNNAQPCGLFVNTKPRLWSFGHFGTWLWYFILWNYFCTVDTGNESQCSANFFVLTKNSLLPWKKFNADVAAHSGHAKPCKTKQNHAQLLCENLCML